MEQVKDIFPTFAVSGVVAAFMWGLSFLDLSPYLLLPLQVVAGLAAAFVIYERTKLSEYRELKELVLRAVRRK